MTVNHGVLGASPCSGAIARGLRERCRRCVDSTSIERRNISLSQAIFGSLAQLVQSICLTSRGSAVRIRQLPLNRSTSLFRETCFFCFLFICLCEHADCTKTKKIDKPSRLVFCFLGSWRSSNLGGRLAPRLFAHQASLTALPRR